MYETVWRNKVYCGSMPCMNFTLYPIYILASGVILHVISYVQYPSPRAQSGTKYDWSTAAGAVFSYSGPQMSFDGHHRALNQFLIINPNRKITLPSMTLPLYCLKRRSNTKTRAQFGTGIMIRLYLLVLIARLLHLQNVFQYVLEYLCRVVKHSRVTILSLLARRF